MKFCRMRYPFHTPWLRVPKILLNISSFLKPLIPSVPPARCYDPVYVMSLDRSSGNDLTRDDWGTEFWRGSSKGLSF